jgi:hypothetical protein
VLKVTNLVRSTCAVLAAFAGHDALLDREQIAVAAPFGVEIDDLVAVEAPST